MTWLRSPWGRDEVRGAVLLKAGTYRVSGTLKMNASGVILRGEGQGEEGTIIIATGKKKRALIEIRSPKMGLREIKGSRLEIVENRVPVGARTIELKSAKELKKGDSIIVHRPGTKEWIRALGTDKLNKGPKDNVNNWKPEHYGFEFERIIIGIRNNTIAIDVPIVFAMEKKYGGGSVYKITKDERIRNVGVEHVRLVSEYEMGKETQDEAHAWEAIKIISAVDSWCVMSRPFISDIVA